MLHLKKVHHIAIICSDYQRSLDFYTRILGFEILAEHYREERQSYKTDLALGSDYVVELFSFPSPPPRPSYPEAAGLRHLAFALESIAEEAAELDRLGIARCSASHRRGKVCARHAEGRRHQTGHQCGGAVSGCTRTRPAL